MDLFLEKAEDLAKKLGHTNYVATEGWLSRWKARHQIRYKRAHGEKGSAALKVLKSGQALFYQGYWKNIGLMRSNETVLYYRATTDHSLCYCHEKLSGSKKAMENITVFLLFKYDRN